MKFRQRIAWLVIMVYLGGTFGFLYYIFEINEHFNRFALEHNNNYHHSDGDQKHSLVGVFWHHLTYIPLQVWIIILILPYLQIFGLILAWTRVEPRRSIAYVWPALVYCQVQRIWRRLRRHSRKHMDSASISNGHIVIDT